MAEKAPADWKDKIMHTALPLGKGLLMGCDALPGRSKPMAGFQVSIELTDKAELNRIYQALSDGGSVQMPLEQTFWSPLFGMCTDKYGVSWMLAVPAGNH